MVTLSALLFENGLPDLPVLLIEPHRNQDGVWRVKFSFETAEPLSMSAEQALMLASGLHGIGETDLADELDTAIQRASHYAVSSFNSGGVINQTAAGWQPGFGSAKKK
jgi:hypothetical protein